MFDVLPVTSVKSVDCGPTSLKMLLDYYGQDISLDALIRECNTRIYGCTGKDLLRVGRNHGLDMICYKMDAAELIRQDRPAIIWWKYTHWCVFCGKDDTGKVVICNPSRGRYGIDEESFAAMYTEVSLWNGEPHDLPEAAEPIEE